MSKSITRPCQVLDFGFLPLLQVEERLQDLPPENSRHRTPPTTSRATPPSHIPFTHHQQHVNSHPIRNTPSHLPAQHLPPKSTIEHHQRHLHNTLRDTPQPHPQASTTSNTPPPPTQTPPATSQELNATQSTPYSWHPPRHLRSSTTIDIANNSPSNILRETFQPHPRSDTTRHPPPATNPAIPRFWLFGETYHKNIHR